MRTRTLLCTWKTLAAFALSIAPFIGCSGTTAATGTTLGGPTGDAGPPPTGEGGAAPADAGPSADFYIATDGDDRWSGRFPSPNAEGTDGPFATVGAAQGAVRALRKQEPKRSTPIVVQMRGGEYAVKAPLAFSGDDSGTPSSSVIYEAYPSEIPIVTGGVHLRSWTASTGGTQTADASSLSAFSQLWINGSRRYRPRTNGGQYLLVAGAVLKSDPSGAGCDVGPDGKTCFDRFSFSPGDVSASLAVPSVEVDFFGQWTMSRMRVQSIDTTNNVLTFTGRVPNDINDAPRAGYRYLVENVQQALSPGQWYLEVDAGGKPSTLTYDPNADEVIEDAVAPQEAQLLVASNLSWVTFRGITFAYTNWVVPADGYDSTHAEPAMTAALSFNASSQITVEGCTLKGMAGYAIEFEGASSHDVVENSLLTDMGTGGVRVGASMGASDTDESVASYVTISNNVIAHGGRLLPAGEAVYVGNSHHDTIEHNDVFDFYNQAINVGASYHFTDTTNFAHDNVIQYNHIYDVGQGVTSDLGAVHHLGISKLSGDASSKGTVIQYNRVHDIASNSAATHGYNGTGLYLDQASSYVTVAHNLVYRTSSQGFCANQVENDSVSNNIFAFDPTVTDSNNGMNSGAFFQANFPAAFALSVTNNIVYFTTPVDPLGGSWLTPSPLGKADHCVDTMGGGEVACSSRFVFDKNVYYDPSTTRFPFAGLTLASWQALGEDVHSVIADPGFVCPGNAPPCTGAAADDYTLKSGSVALGLGFVPFDAPIATAGYQPEGGLVAPPVATAFPAAE
jgi:hypothetical protein